MSFLRTTPMTYRNSRELAESSNPSTFKTICIICMNQKHFHQEKTFFNFSVHSRSFITLRNKIRLTARMEEAKLRQNKLDTLRTFLKGNAVKRYESRYL